MDRSKWSIELDKLVSATERRTSTALVKIKEKLNRANLPCDDKFRSYFLQAVNNRLCETFDRFEIEVCLESAETDQRNKSAEINAVENGPIENNNVTSSNLEKDNSHNSKKTIEVLSSFCGNDLSANASPVILIESSSDDSPLKSSKILRRKHSPVHHLDNKIPKLTIDADIEDGEILSNNTIFDNVLFTCAHCYDKQIVSINSTSDNIETIYAHWLLLHTEPPDEKPFQFYACELVWCNYCLYFGIFTDLKCHHKTKHPDEPMVLSNRRLDIIKCAMCSFNGQHLKEHFMTEHQNAHELTAFGPICFSIDILKRLLDIDVHKMRRCNYCRKIFDTPIAMRKHHQLWHLKLKMNFDEFSIEKHHYIICNYCDARIRNSYYLKHIKNHAYEFQCSNMECSFRTNTFSRLTRHDKIVHKIDSLKFNCEQMQLEMKEDFLNSKYVFGNGLVVSQQSLLCSKYDISKTFEMCMNTFIENEKEKFNKLINSIENDDIVSLESSSTLSDAGQSTSSTSFELIAVESVELKKQEKLRNNISIQGIPIIKCEDLPRAIKSLGFRLGVMIGSDHIIEAYQLHSSSAIRTIVKFRDYVMKKEMMAAILRQKVRSDEIMNLTNDIRPEYIRIDHDLTMFYRKLQRAAAEAQRIGLIYSHRITSHGYVIQRTKDCLETLVSTTDQIFKSTQ